MVKTRATAPLNVGLCHSSAMRLLLLLLCIDARFMTARLQPVRRSEAIVEKRRPAGIVAPSLQASNSLQNKLSCGVGS